MNDTCPDRVMRGGGAPMAAAVTAALRFYAAIQCLIDEPWPPSPQVPNGTHFDFIVVGAGTAGSTLAARLAEDYQFSVLLVEAGQRPPEESIVPGFKHVLKHSPYDWNFTTVNDGYTSQGLFNGQQLQPRGKVLGGSGSISDMVYSRGFPEDYYEWADIAGGDWNWTNVLHYFKKTEYMTDKNIINNSELMQFHGRQGEIEVSGVGEPVGYVDKLLEAFNELGFDIVDDMTYPYKIGAGRFSHTIANGRRASALTALVNKVHTNNFSVINATLVTKILLNENNTATGISAVTDGQVKQYFADREVIVSAGAFNTPKLLMLSGIGPKRHLDALGIEVIQDLPVGSNLHDHIMILNFLTIKNGTCPYIEHEKDFELIKYLDSFTGIFGQSDSMGVHIPKDGKSGTPQFAIYPACMPIGGLTFDGCMSILGYKTSTCEELVAANSEHEMVSLAVVHLKPQSRGRVRLASTDAVQNPLIYSETFSSLADFEGFTDAMRVALSVANTTYFKSQDARVFNFKTSRCYTIETEETRLRCQMMDYAMPAWHAVGTAAMASVVNEKFQVLGVKALRVVDASAMPVIVRGNINAVVIMMAEQAAEFIKEHHLLSNQTVTDNDLYYLT